MATGRIDKVARIVAVERAGPTGPIVPNALSAPNDPDVWNGPSGLGVSQRQGRGGGDREGTLLAMDST